MDNIKLDDIVTYIQKAAKLDAIVDYIKATRYADKNDILVIAGEKPMLENGADKDA